MDSALGHQDVQERALEVEAVFGLLEDAVGMGLEDLLGDLAAAVGGQAVQDERAGFGAGEEGAVELVGREVGLPLLLLALLAMETQVSV